MLARFLAPPDLIEPLKHREPFSDFERQLAWYRASFC